MNAKAIIPLVVGLGIAGVAAKLGFDYVNKAKGETVQTVKLWAPLQDIPRGVAISESMLKPIAFPKSIAPAGALRDPKKIVGRVPHTNVPAGVPILDSELLPPGQRPGLQVPPGYRAVAVKIDESSGVDNHLEPGCRVDVVGVFTVRRNNRAETLAKTLIENVEVAAVGQRIAPPTPTPAEEKQGKKGGKRERPPRAVTLYVRPQQVPVLHLAEQKGKIKLAMRGLTDAEPADEVAQIDEDTLLGDGKQDKDENAGPSLAEQVSGFFGTLLKSDEPPAPQPAPEPEPEPVVQTPPQPKWVMVVCNGDDRQMLAWMEMDSFQPIELASGETNIFEDQPPQSPAQPRRHGTTAGGRDGAVGADRDGATDRARRDTKARRATRKPPADDPAPTCGSGCDENKDEGESQSEPKELLE